jgi:hypothetical protein
MLKLKAEADRQSCWLLTFTVSLLLAGSLIAAERASNEMGISSDVAMAQARYEVGGQSGDSGASGGTEWIPDSARYIGLDEIRPGMDAYCLTEYGPAGIERFGLEVIDVVRNMEPDRDVILVKGTDERFIHTGPVAGCSGSPVYIEGRLAGALAFAWTYSKDPLYGATPIGEMLRVGRGSAETARSSSGLEGRGIDGGERGYTFDFTKPIDFSEIDRQIRFLRVSDRSRGGVSTLPCPLITTGLPSTVCEQLKASVAPLGLMVVPGIGGTLESATNETIEGAVGGRNVRLLPGACLAIPLLSGDLTMSVYGTVTEVRDDKVYAFGHGFLGYGPVDLPIATGRVHTVLSSMLRSSKLCSVGETIGALRVDEGTGVLGRIGATARTFPLTIRIDRYNDTEKRTYNCRVASNRVYTPTVLRTAVSGAALVLGDLPPDHMIEYSGSIGVEGFEPITFANVSTSLGTAEVVAESVGVVALLMSNPYKEVNIQSIDLDIRVANRNIVGHIWSAELSDSEVKAGDQIEVRTVVESVRSLKKEYALSLQIPDDLEPGKYELTVSGSRDYEQFLLKAVPYRFVAQSLPDLVTAIRESLRVDRDSLYCRLVLPAHGVTVEKAELPDLPATKALLLQNTKRALRIQPYQRWIEKRTDADAIITDKKVMQITVEK